MTMHQDRFHVIGTLVFNHARYCLCIGRRQPFYKLRVDTTTPAASPASAAEQARMDAVVWEGATACPVVWDGRPLVINVSQREREQQLANHERPYWGAR